MNTFAYEDMGDEKFEQLTVLLCQQILGMAVQGFTSGKDGGRDARFEGTAQYIPSTANPWVGKVVIQSKHTNGYNMSFSDADFFTDSKRSILAKEIPRIKKLRADGKLDHYMLFSNRRLTAGAEDKIREHIAAACAIPSTSILVCGVELLDTWLMQYRHIVAALNIDPVDSPLIVDSSDLATIIEVLAKSIGTIAHVDQPPGERTTYAAKNKDNNMTDAFAREMRNRYLKEASQISSFLSEPANLELMHVYESVTEDFELHIISKRKGHQTFDEVMIYLMDLLIKRDPVFRRPNNKRLLRAIIFYMYWNCDIGKIHDPSAN